MLITQLSYALVLFHIFFANLILFCFIPVNMRDLCVIVLVVCQVLSVNSQYVLDSCVDSSQTKRSVKLNCGNGGRITNINVRSGIGDCGTIISDRCYGKTAKLLVSHLNCYWKSNCVIEWPNEPIITADNNGRCIGMKPTFLQVSYRCYQPTTVIEENRRTVYHPNRLLLDICHSVNNGESEYKITGHPNLSGIIRSHPIYPWDYSTVQRTCSVKLYWPTNQTLIVTVWDLELGEDDTLKVFGHHTKEVLTSGMNLIWPQTSSTKTTFTFSVSSHSNSGRGFMVCFLFVDKGDDRTHNACNSITMAGLIENIEPTTIRDNMFSDFLLPRNDLHTASLSDEEINIPRRCMKRKSMKTRERCIAKLERRSKGRNGKQKRRRNKNKNRKRKYRNKNLQ
ncbi:hypothetical protein ACF0H5_007995 [Mactra antiquata]